MDLGSQLFHRVGRRVLLTDAGHALIGPARQVVRGLAVARSSVEAVEHLHTVRVEIAAMPSPAVEPLSSMILVLISHDLRVVRYLCDRVAVMYLGQIVEVAPRDELFTRPRHPYTRVLLAASLAEESGGEDMVSRLRGEPPSPIDPPSGCRFHPRCPMAQDVCRSVVPKISHAGEDHIVTCHFWD